MTNNEEFWFNTTNGFLRTDEKPATNQAKDPVNHPSHYTDGNIEVIDYIEDKGLGFCLGNAVKYISRAGKKKSDGMDDIDKEIQDLEKAVWYVNRRIKELRRMKTSEDTEYL